MWASLLALFPTIFGWINDIIGYFQNQSAEQTAADTAEKSAEAQHENDGSQSVDDKTSADAQNEALNKLDQNEDNPIPVVVNTPPKGSA